MMKKYFFASILLSSLCVFTLSTKAQNTSSSYKTAIGAKAYGGAFNQGAINIKHFLNSTSALEGSLSFGNNFTAVEAVYEWHQPINNAPGLLWYVGPGASLGSVKNGSNSSTLFLAAKGTLGLDYKVKGAPINFALDINPQLRLTQQTDFDIYAGFAFRFAF